MLRVRLIVATLASLAAFCVSTAAQAPQAWTQVGSLMCKVDPNVGFIFVGHQPMQCTYTPSLAPAPPEYYDGAINTVGIDVGVSAGSVLAWGVFAPTTGLPQGALSLSTEMRLVLMTGFLGGLTTFSTYEYESFLLATHHEPGRALINLLGSVGLGLLAVAFGYLLTRTMIRS